MSDQAILEKIKEGDEEITKELYNTYKEAFQLFIYKYYKLDNETTKDLYQETWMALYDNLVEGRLLKLTSTLKTYLFQIGRNQALNLLKKLERLTDETKHQTIEELEGRKTISIETIDEDNDDIKQNIVRRVVANLTKACKNILKPFYYENKKLDEILYTLTNYASKDALKTKKYKCMKSLENMLREQFLIEGLL